MGKLAFSLFLIILNLLIMSNNSRSQFCFVNSYSFRDGAYSNAVYKIDIVNSQIVDSVFFAEKGEFTAKHPAEITFRNQKYLLSSFNSGQPAKNSVPGPYIVTHLNLLRYRNLNPIFQDSLMFSQVTKIKEIGNDSLEIEWFADNQIGGGIYLSKFVFRSNLNRLEKITTIPLSQQSSITVGNYTDPVWITNFQDKDYYWDIVDGANIVLFKVDNNGVVMDETAIGDRTINNIAIGFNMELNKIIYIKTPFRLLSYNPAYESPENIEAQIIYLSLADFSVENIIPIDMGNAYCGYEVGKAFSYGSYTYYYYFSGDGYGQFDPAYLLIFDTRTNEATWLRVGWR